MRLSRRWRGFSLPCGRQCAPLLAMVFLALGCAADTVYKKVDVPQAKMNAMLRGKPRALHGGYRHLLRDGERNAVLNYMRLGLDALQLNHIKPAEDSFDRAIARIESVFANNEAALKARSLWYAENVKDFKGEPYERSMVFYYRGLLYFMNGEYDNARASFRSGILQDAFAEERQNRSDFALLIFLEGWASRWAGEMDITSARYKETKKLRPKFRPPAPVENVLILVETGKSPRKVSDGLGHHELKFRRGKRFKEHRALVRINGQGPVRAVWMESVFWQATTRGSRVVDKILQNKVVFKRNATQLASGLADAASVASMMSVVSNSNAAAGVAGALSVASVVATMAAMNAKPNADTRYWDNLPDAVHMHTLRLPPGEHRVEVFFQDRAGRPLPRLGTSATFRVQAGKPVIVWLRSRRQLTSATPAPE